MTGYPDMMIDIGRLRQSDFDATPDDAAWRAGFNLWFSAWESVPAGSLRQDDASLAKAAGLGRDLRAWARVKDAATHGFVLCSDGRLYHRTVCARALGIWIDKLIRRHAGQNGNRGAQSPVDRATALRLIEEQICDAAACLRALEPSAPALTKSSRFEALCDRNAVPNAPAMQPQEKGREGNGSVEDPSQSETSVVGFLREAVS